MCDEIIIKISLFLFKVHKIFNRDEKDNNKICNFLFKYVETIKELGISVEKARKKVKDVSKELNIKENNGVCINSLKNLKCRKTSLPQP